jgi:hypothetical protein
VRPGWLLAVTMLWMGAAAGCGEADTAPEGAALGEACIEDDCVRGLYCGPARECVSSFDVAGRVSWQQSRVPDDALYVWASSNGGTVLDAAGEFRVPPGEGPPTEYENPVYPVSYAVSGLRAGAGIVTAFVIVGDQVGFGQIQVLVDEHGGIFDRYSFDPLESVDIVITNEAILAGR